MPKRIQLNPVRHAPQNLFEISASLFCAFVSSAPTPLRGMADGGELISANDNYVPVRRVA